MASTIEDVEGELISSVVGNDLDEVRKIIDSLSKKERGNLNSTKVDGHPLLVLACLEKATKIVEYLIEDCGIDINSAYDVSGEILTPVFLTIRTENLSLLQTLIRREADLSWKDPENRNAIVFACYEKKYEAAKILSENGADINSDKNVYYCAEDKDYLIAAMKFGINLQHADSFGNTVLMKATLNGKIAIMAKTLNKNSNPYHRNKIGANALDIAVFKGGTAEITLLTRFFYSRADYAHSLEYCGAYSIVFTRDMGKCLKFWQESIIHRRMYAKEIPPKSDFAPKNFPLNLQEFDIGTDLDMRSERDLLIDALLVFSRILSTENLVTRKAFCCIALSSRIDDIQTRFNALIHVMQLNASASCLNESDIFFTWHVFVKLTSKYFLILDVTKFEEVYTLSNNIANIIREYVWPFLRSKPRHLSIHIERYRSLQMMVLRYLQFLSNQTSNPAYKKVVLLLGRTLAKEECSAIKTTLLHLAVSNKFSCNVINLLIECRADINAVDKKGNTPLHLVIDRSRSDPDRDKIACLFILAGCDMNAKNNSDIILREYFRSLHREVKKLKTKV